MKERILILHDLVSIIERMKFNIVAFEFIELIIVQEITKNDLTIEELTLLKSIRKKYSWLILVGFPYEKAVHRIQRTATTFL